MSAGRNPVLELELWQGADPILVAASGQLPASAQPYRLALRGDQRELADHYAEEIRGRIALNPDAGKPAERFLLPAPSLPRQIKAYDGIDRVSGVEWKAPGRVPAQEDRAAGSAVTHCPSGS